MEKILLGLMLAVLLGGCASNTTNRGAPSTSGNFGSGDANDPYRQIVPVP